MANIVIFLIVLLAILNVSFGAYCNGNPAAGERVNSLPIVDERLKFRGQIKNAMHFQAGPANAIFDVVHVWGTPYEMGFAQGTLMKKEVVTFIAKTWAYLSEEMASSFPGDHLSDAMKEFITQKGIDRALDWTAKVTAPFTSQDIYDEMRGLADATGISYDTILRLNMFPELSKAACSFLGAWGEAVKKDGYTYHLRSLDYDVDGPFKDYPQVTIYHPNNGNAFAQVGWPGSVGALTGMNEQAISISEIGVSFPDDSFEQGTVPNTPPEEVHGQPWMFVLRDVLQFSSNIEEAKNTVTNANRTCNLIIGLGSGKDQHVYGTQYSGRVANFYDNTNQLPVNDTWHPVVQDTVYNGMDWLCPGYTQPLGEQLQKYNGQIDENVIIGNILPTVQTGNLHIAVFDDKDQNMHVSFCKRSTADPAEPNYAYERQFTRLHMKDIFAQKAPQL